MIEYRTTVEGLNKNELEGFFVNWQKPLTKKQHYLILKNSSFTVLAYDIEKSKVIGFINALSDGINFAFIPMLEVLPKYKNQGIGSNLMKRMLELLKEIPCIDLTCDKNMQTFYEKFSMLKSHGMVIRKYINKN
ncbi:MAG: GNAT family N-acetyltransferase [Firmicutes bacterium]|nr:GNAT family N-acetyltransferase [Bacillota bacterium]